ncbi:uncharacterized protein LOC100830428 [Brachypodium distachyon]|uniref:FLZ-type domain-containing protein n=1 Tax=Brachypodium distachyon TaxID=15368 RepID=I1HXT3_BRADI|nr:uncharacterized protein LOC100830428 [Brachypodium distachyon]KQJ93587.1 hypothetical protein BRADI_3g05560v3 [Brachypodium distachyon]|eukprot:XP_003570391.1 uncharacterized protein LOC100830428 [Brachypodium distachyon]
MMRTLEPATGQKASPSFASLLSVFLGASGAEQPRPKRSFDVAGGVVGLGIVAAMGRACLAAQPIAIGAAARRRAREEAELSESYTCVITHVPGGRSVRKRVYFGNGWLVEAGEAPARSRAADFLSRCYLCTKRLDGLDIYMYGGEKAFCSSECRCHQMLMDDRADNCGSEALRANNYSASQCSAPMSFSPSIAAA